MATLGLLAGMPEALDAGAVGVANLTRLLNKENASQ